MKAAIFFSLLLASGFAFPSSVKKPGKFPKKYNQALHGAELKDKGDVSHASQTEPSTYQNYETFGKMDQITPPSQGSYTSRLIRYPAPQFSSPSGFIYHRVVGAPKVSVVAPSEDSYSRYAENPVVALNPPSQERQASSVYLGYTQVGGDKTESMKPPQISTYADAEVGVAKTEASEQVASHLQPPSIGVDSKPSTQSSYVSYKVPVKSSYSQYDSESIDKIAMRPPPVPSS